MPIKTKRWNDPRKKSDGFRILVCRYRPRALTKEAETWDHWQADLAPSRELHAAHYGKNGETPISWDEFCQRYREEMKGADQRQYIEFLAEKVAAGKTITLLCSNTCKKAARCHRSLLKELIEEHIAGTPAGPREKTFIPEAVG